MADSSSPLDSTASVPDHFVCPISLEIMQDPVICSDGNTYERREIARWLTNHDTSPKTNMILANKVLIPNHAIKSGIARFLSAIPEEKAKPKKMKTRSAAMLVELVDITVEGKMQVFVRLITNTSISVYVDKHATTQDLMEEIKRTEGILACHQRLIHAGKQMDPAKTLSQCGVHSGSVVHLVLRLVGGLA